LPDNGWPATGAIVGVGAGVGEGFATAVWDVEGLGVTRTAGAIGRGDGTMAGASAEAEDAVADAGADSTADDASAGEATGETGAGAEPGVDDAAAAELDGAGADATAACLVELVHAASATSTTTPVTRRARAARDRRTLSVGRGMLHADTRSPGAAACRRFVAAHVGSGSDHDPLEEDVHGTGCTV
jgi:hypothetical protein